MDGEESQVTKNPINTIETHTSFRHYAFLSIRPDSAMKVSHRFAVFSDIHANLPALQAVLNDIDRMEIRDIFCLGDLVDFAPWPNEVIGLPRTRAIPVLIGNHDYRVAYPIGVSGRRECAA